MKQKAILMKTVEKVEEKNLFSVLDNLGYTMYQIWETKERMTKEFDIILNSQLLNRLDFNDHQKFLISSMINKFGNDQPPICDDKNFEFFYISYLQGVFKKSDSLIEIVLSDSEKDIYHEVKNILGMGKCQHI